VTEEFTKDTNYEQIIKLIRNRCPVLFKQEQCGRLHTELPDQDTNHRHGKVPFTAEDNPDTEHEESLCWDSYKTLYFKGK
jgi:hypothetical protein